nr:hypothetical protein [Tanacetum cinerariifolium]
MEEDHSINVIEVTKLIVLNKQIVEQENEVESNGDNVLPKVTDPDTVIEEVIGFEVKKSGQKLTKSGAVQHKYIMCNREGVPKVKSHVIQLESHVIQVESYVIQLESHVIQVKSHVIQLESHVIQVESYVIQLESHMIQVESHVIPLVSNVILLESHIPAYFIYSPLYGLMRTTSRSESENSFFKSFISSGATLVSFMISYESAMERQRCRQETLDFKTIDASLKCETNLEIERHATRVYTRTIFLLVQTGIIEGCWSCTIQDLKINEGCETVIIKDKKPNDSRSLFHKKGKEQEKKTRTLAEAEKDYQ